MRISDWSSDVCSSDLTLAGTPVSRGKTRSVRGHPGTYNILYCYKDEKVGLAAGAAAIRLIGALVPAEFSQVEGLDTLGMDIGWEATDVASIQIGRAHV